MQLQGKSTGSPFPNSQQISSLSNFYTEILSYGCPVSPWELSETVQLNTSPQVAQSANGRAWALLFPLCSSSSQKQGRRTIIQAWI